MVTVIWLHVLTVQLRLGARSCGRNSTNGQNIDIVTALIILT